MATVVTSSALPVCVEANAFNIITAIQIVLYCFILHSDGLGQRSTRDLNEFGQTDRHIF